MFSVNVDKLIKMTPEESISYAVTAEAVLKKIEGWCRTIGVVGGAVCSFKLASALMEKGRRVLFIDADTSEDVFLNKYRLGKDLKGFTDYLRGTETADRLVCVTNRAQLDIIFTGSLDHFKEKQLPAEKIPQLFAESLDTYDLIVVRSDEDGTVAAYCDGTILFMEASAYSETAGEVKVDALNEKGCLVLGVIVDE